MRHLLNPNVLCATSLPKRARCTVALFLVLIFASAPSWAGLGQPEASVNSDVLQLKSQDHVQTALGYRVHELANANGPTIREYVTPQGVVFGVAWQGRSAPDMNQLLGAYVSNLQTATPAQTQVHHLRGLSVKTGDFVYSNFCRLRTCTGSAYVPSLVPNNVSAEVVR